MKKITVSLATLDFLHDAVYRQFIRFSRLRKEGFRDLRYDEIFHLVSESLIFISRLSCSSTSEVSLDYSEESTCDDESIRLDFLHCFCDRSVRYLIDNLGYDLFMKYFDELRNELKDKDNKA